MQPKDQPFPKYAHDYFAQLREQYQLVLEQTQQAAPPSIAALMQRAQTEPDKVSWSDVFALETAYLYAIPPSDLPRLREELKIARDRYRDVVGSREFASYLQTVQGDVTKVAAPDARAELLALAERLRYLYTFVPPKESVRNAIGRQAAMWTFVAALIGVGVWAATEWWLHQTLFTIVIVLFVGEMGGFVSVQQRLNSGPTVDPLFKELQLTYGWFSVVVIAPITGAIFAIVLYFVFVGGLLSGGLFPEFGPPAFASSAAQRGAPAPIPSPSPCPTSASGETIPCTPVQSTQRCATDPRCPPNITLFLWRATPTTIKDWGKLLVWAFIAGFAERFVPDVLTRLTGGASSGSGGEKVPSSKPGGDGTPSASRKGANGDNPADAGGTPGGGHGDGG